MWENYDALLNNNKIKMKNLKKDHEIVVHL